MVVPAVIETAVADPSVNAVTATGTELEVGGAVAELPETVPAPAVDGTRVQQRTRMGAPAVIETAVADPTVNAATATGTELSVVVLLPSCPSPLEPQQLTAPVFNNAHVWELAGCDRNRRRPVCKRGHRNRRRTVSGGVVAELPRNGSGPSS